MDVKLTLRRSNVSCAHSQPIYGIPRIKQFPGFCHAQQLASSSEFQLLFLNEAFALEANRC